MPTESEKQAEKDRVTRISGFRVGFHDFLSEVDLAALKKRNDGWESEHSHQSLLDRKIEDLTRIDVKSHAIERAIGLRAPEPDAIILGEIERLDGRCHDK